MDDITSRRTKLSLAEWEESLRRGEHPVHRPLNIVRVAPGYRIAVCHASLTNEAGRADADWSWAGSEPRIYRFAELPHELPHYEKLWWLGVTGPCVVDTVHYDVSLDTTRIAMDFDNVRTYWCPSEDPENVLG